jgi:glycerol kinase
MSAGAPAPLYLAIDQGGHASRALVFDSRGSLLAKGVTDVGVTHPAPDRVEQDPEELVASIRSAVAQALAATGDAQGCASVAGGRKPGAASRAQNIVAAGLATQRSTIVCWDRETGAALSPAISWQDRRAHAWLQQFAAHAETIHRSTGLMLSAHYGASKLRWCLDHLPAVQEARTAGRLAMGPLASFLVFRLLQERPLLVDPANAARTLLWNLATLNWDPRLTGLFGVPAECLPRCVPSRHDYGTLTAGEMKIPLAHVNGDQSAALYAYGQPHANTGYINIGTGAFVLRPLGQYPGHRPRLLTSVALHDGMEVTYVMEGTVNGAGAALAWVGEQLGLVHVEQQLAEWLARPGEPPLFLNGIAGLGSPFWQPEFASRFMGDGEPWQKVVAVAESIVFLLQANLDEMKRLASPFEQLFVTGGLSAVDALCQRLADLNGRAVYRPVEHEATARGTAFVLANCPADWPEAEFGVWFKPAANEALRARYQRWRAAMPPL